MSTYISPVAQKSQYVSGIPLDLIMQVGAQKQMQYDNTRDYIQSELDIIGSSEIIKDSDRAYINSKLQDTVNKMNEYSEGADLSNATVFNELRGMVGSLKSDNELYTRIYNNKKASAELRRINQLKQEGDETYNSANEKVFMDQLMAWQNNPDQINFNASYTPYYNYNKASMELIKPILENPDIRQEIETFIDTDGIRKNRSQTEVKEITQQKIMQALRGLPEAAINQMRIDYKAMIGNVTVNGALEDLQNRLEVRNSQLTQYKESLANPEISENLKDQIRSQIESIEQDISNIQATANAVVVNNDPSLLYTEQGYIQDKIYDFANSYAYRQEGPLKIDPFFSKELDFEYDKALKEIEHKYKVEEERIKALNNIKKEEAKRRNLENVIANPFEDSMLQFKFTGKGTLQEEEAFMLFNNVGKVNDDGSRSISLTNRELFLSTSPALSNVQMDNEVQAAAYQKAQQAYKQWLDKQGAQEPKDDNIWSRMGTINRMSNPIMSKNVGTGKPVKSFEEFLASTEGKELNKLTKPYGLDLSDKNNIAKVKTYVNSGEASELDATLGELLTNLKGTANITIDNTENIISDVNGQMYVKGNLRITKADLISRLGGKGFIFDSVGEDIVEKLEDEGRIKPIQGEGSETIYELPIITKPDLDLNQANSKYIRKNILTGDKATLEEIPIYEQHFRESIGKADRYNYLLGIETSPHFAQAVGIGIMNLVEDSDKLSIEDKKVAIAGLESLIQKAKDPNTSIQDKMKAKEILATYVEADIKSIEDFLKVTERLAGEENTSTPSVSVPTGYNLPNKKQIESFLKIPTEYKNKIVDAADKYGVPSNLLQALIYQESSYNPTAKSPKGALGLAQFMPTTAAQYGVDRTDPNSSIEGAARYLSDLYAQFRDWNLALAAYNAGPNRQSLREGRIPDIPETKEYVARVNAYKNQLTNSQ